MRKFLIFSLMLVAGLQWGCSAEDRSEAAGEAVLTDSELEQRVEAQISTDSTLADTISVDADAAANSVTLEGTVESEAQRDEARQLAENAHPGLIVNNQIEIRPRELSREEYTEDHARDARERATQFGDKIGNSIDDAWIHTKVTGQLIGDGDTSAREINVDVNANVVTLRGTVDTAEEKAEAARIATETEGVKSVNNQLRVSATP